MIACAYCQRPLICEGCQTPYLPPSQEDYDAMSRPDVPILCRECGQILVCHWCKTPYDGLGDEPEEGSEI